MLFRSRQARNRLTTLMRQVPHNLHRGQAFGSHFDGRADVSPVAERVARVPRTRSGRSTRRGEFVNSVMFEMQKLNGTGPPVLLTT